MLSSKQLSDKRAGKSQRRQAEGRRERDRKRRNKRRKAGLFFVISNTVARVRGIFPWWQRAVAGYPG